MAREVRIRYHYDSKGTWWADSPDLPRFTAAGETFDAVRREAREGAAFFADEPVLVVEEGVPEGVASGPDRVFRVVAHQGIALQSSAGGAVPTVVMHVESASDRGAWLDVKGAELVTS
jgi:predicted RNase H-like HicB family nuclease